MKEIDEIDISFFPLQHCFQIRVLSQLQFLAHLGFVFLRDILFDRFDMRSKINF